MPSSIKPRLPTNALTHKDSTGVRTAEQAQPNSSENVANRTAGKDISDSRVSARKTEIPEKSLNLGNSITLPRASRSVESSFQLVPRSVKRKTAESEQRSDPAKKQRPQPSEIIPLTTKSGIIYTSGEITARNVTWAQESIDRHTELKLGTQLPSKKDVESLGNGPASNNRPAYIYEYTSYQEKASGSSQRPVASASQDIIRADLKKGMVVVIEPPNRVKTGYSVRDNNGNKSKEFTQKVFQRKLERDLKEED